MKELIIAFGLFLFIEGVLYAIFPSKMKSMLKKLELINDSQLRSGGLIFAIIGFVIIYFVHKVPELIPDSIEIADGIFWGGDFEAIQSLLKEDILSKHDIRFFLGYTGWSSGQLESEILEKTWIISDNTYKEKIISKHFSGALPYYDCELRMKHKNGNWIWIQDRGRVATRTHDGKPLMMFGMHSLITERKENEEKIEDILEDPQRAFKL